MRVLVLLVLILKVLIADEISEPFIQTGHNNGIRSVELSSDGKYALSSSESVKLWDIKSGKLLKTFTGHLGVVNSAVFSPNSKYILSGGDDGNIKLWDVKTGKELKTLKSDGSAISSVGFHPNGKYIFSSDTSGFIHLWNISTEKIFRTLDLVEVMTRFKSVAFSPNGEYIVAGNLFGILRVWNINSGKEVLKLKVFGDDSFNSIESVDIHPNGKDILVGSSSGLLKILDLNTGKEIQTLYDSQGDYDEVIISSVFSPNGKYVIAGMSNGKVFLWDMENKQKVKKFKSKSEVFTFVAFSLDQKYILSGEGDNLILWDIKKYEKVQSFLDYGDNRPRILAYDNDGKYIFSKSGKSDINGRDTYHLWDIKKGVKVKSFKNKIFDNSIFQFMSEKQLLVLGNGKLVLWDIENGKVVKTLLKGLSKEFSSSMLNRNNDKVVFVDDNGLVKVFDISSKQYLLDLNSTIAKYSASSFNQKLAFFSLNDKYFSEVEVWNLRTKQKEEIFEVDKDNFDYQWISTISLLGQNPQAKKLGFNSNDFFLLKVKDKILEKYLLPMFSGMPDGQFYDKSKTLLTLDNKLIVAQGLGGGIAKFDIKTEKKLQDFKGHKSDIFSLEMSSDEKKIYTSSSDKTIKIWNQNTAKELVSLSTFGDKEWISITPEGYFTGSKEALNYLNITRYTQDGMKPFSMSQLYDYFFRPDFVKIKLSKNEELFQEISKKLTYTEALQNPPPTVKIKNKNKKVHQQKIKLSFDIEDNKGGVGLIRIYQEGKLIQTIGEGKVNKQSANIDTLLEQNELDKANQANQKMYLSTLFPKAIEDKLEISDTVADQESSSVTNKAGAYTIEVDLISGKNEIAIEAFNKTNTVASFRESILIEADIPKKEPKLYAIVVGVDEFEHKPKKFNLNYAQNDAQSVKQAIENRISKTFNETEVKYLIGKEVTKNNILDAAKAIAQKAKLEDTIIFYISTHGRVVKGDLYFMPYNNSHAKDYIDFQQTFNAIQSIKALNQIFIVDACESGKANDIVSAVYDSRASVLAKSAGVHMLLATTKGAYAFEPNPKEKGEKKVETFTQRVLKAMNNKSSDTNGDGFVSIVELSKNLKDNQESVEYQYPVIRNVGGDVRLVRVKQF